MGLVISKGLTLRKGYIGTDDPDAEAYIAAVEAADLAADPTAEPLETATKVAIHSFVKGAKADGIWPAIKASCILAGARTLAGALVPLVGAAPTNNGPFVAADYNRETGLVGDGSTKYLDSNRDQNADPLNNNHLSVYVATSGSAVGGAEQYIAGNAHDIFRADVNNDFRIRNRSSIVIFGNKNLTGFAGTSRASSALFTARAESTTQSSSGASTATANVNIAVFRRLAGSAQYANARIAFYSIGESLDLALLDARVTDLINAFAAAIP
jgi:hypothetical protein